MTTNFKFRHIFIATLIAIEFISFAVCAKNTDAKEKKKWERKIEKTVIHSPLLAQRGQSGGPIRISPGIRKIPIAVPLLRVEPDT